MTRELRRPAGANSLIRLIALGTSAPSARPVKKRPAPSSSGSRACPVRKAARLASRVVAITRRRRPKRSASGASRVPPKSMPNSAQLPRVPACTGLSCHSCIRRGTTEP
ncbi:Uncharacterised protein [Acinetobacter baumannii]|nr:Uncharacterised protein [Acinetobacter baumannii]